MIVSTSLLSFCRLPLLLNLDQALLSGAVLLDGATPVVRVPRLQGRQAQRAALARQDLATRRKWH